MLDPSFWERKESTELSSELARLNTQLSRWNQLEKEYEDLQMLTELLSTEEDEELAKEFVAGVEQWEKEADGYRIEQLLSGPYDNTNAIMTVHAGSGGLDSQDWAEMLYRMYLRWAETHDYKVKTLDYQKDEEAGVKSATFVVSGPFAYGYLKSEIGVHRLVRISPFDTQKRRHTSFASVVLSPEMPDDVAVEIKDEDLRIDTYRSSGAGGQHVNMTDSAVRITHLPTGIVVSCQNERSQHMNKASAMNVLKSKLYEIEMKNRQDELDQLAGEKKETSWGSQIRSYVLQPYTLCKDHRTNHETGNVSAVLDGDLDDFMFAFLKWDR